MHKELRPEQINILVGSPAVNDEFSRKTRELDRRLQMNGMQYRDWDTLNDRQHNIFIDNLFLDGECASSVDHYVKGAVASCGCPDTEEDLHHHSPVLMREIEKQEDMLPDIKVKIGESLNNLNDMIDLVVENLLVEYAPEETLPEYEAMDADHEEEEGSTDPVTQKFNAATAAALTVLKKLNKTVENADPTKPGTPTRAWYFTNTAGPRQDRENALTAIKNTDAFAGAEFKDAAKKYKGFDAYWKDLDLWFKIRISRGSAKGIGNKGDILEGLLATAFYLRFLNPRVGFKPASLITADDIFTHVRKLKATAAPLGKRGKSAQLEATRVREVGGAKHEDTIQLVIELAKGVFDDMTATKEVEDEGGGEDEMKWATELKPLAEAAAQAVNIEAVQDTANFLANNTKADVIRVSAKGLTGQTTTKVDLYIQVLTTNAKGEEEEQSIGLHSPPTAQALMKRVGQLSLKLESRLLGQTGKKWETQYKIDKKTGEEIVKSRGIQDSIKELFGVDLGDQSIAWQKEIAAAALLGDKGASHIKTALKTMVMEPVETEVSELLKGKGEKGRTAREALLDRIVAGVKYAATKGEEDVGFLRVAMDKEKGQLTARYLNWYEKLTDAIKGGKIEDPTDLGVTLSMGRGDNPMLLFYDKNKSPEAPPSSASDSSILFSYRGKADDKAGKVFRTYIEYGDRLEELIGDIEPKALAQIKKKAEKESEED